jgi:hypothetical protein
MERVEHDAACIEAGAVFLVLQTDTCDEGGEATGLFALELGVVAGLDVDSASFDRVMSCSPGRSSVSGTRRARGRAVSYRSEAWSIRRVARWMDALARGSIRNRGL